MNAHTYTEEARAVREQRRELQCSQPVDPLAERAHLVARWRELANTNPGYAPSNGAWWHPFVYSPAHFHLLMPALRAKVEANERRIDLKYAVQISAMNRRDAQRKAKLAEAWACDARREAERLGVVNPAHAMRKAELTQAKAREAHKRLERAQAKERAARDALAALLHGSP